MKKSIYMALSAGIFLFISMSISFTSSSSEKDHVKWLINAFGTLSSTDHPLVSRVENVFDRVRTASDKRSDRLPKLVIVSEIGDPWVMCRKDGTVVLTQKGMEICYRDVDKQTGDARVAFILGHELAHLVNDDFWDVEVSEVVQKFGSGSKAVRKIIKSENIENRRKKELHADAYGLVYASMAGYSPKAIVDKKGKNFFQKWTDLTTGKITYADIHPDPEHRALFLLLKIEAVKNDLVLFDLGVRLCQLGMYKEALDFLETFQRKFPCREVFNNIGFIHYQVAVKALAEFNRDKAYKYKLSTILDTETRARTFRGYEDIFKKEIQKAIRNFRYACEKDSFYVPARVNLTSALIMKSALVTEDNIFFEAMKVLDEALQIKKDDLKVLNNRAVAIYRLGLAFNADKFQEATSILKSVIKKDPNFSDASYNLGRILAERKENMAAREAWGKYLHLEPTGIYAQIVRKDKDMGIKNTLDNQDEFPKFFSEYPPVKLGGIDRKAEKLLSKIPKHLFDLEKISGEYYIGKNFRVLMLEDEVELVESTVRQKLNYSDVVSVYGKPYRTFTSISGKKILVYKKFALDIRDGIAINVIHFDKEHI